MFHALFVPRTVIILSVAICLIFSFTLLSRNYHSQWITTSAKPLYDSPRPDSPLRLDKPKNLTISGMVFFGRRDRVRTMHCYVERNLVDNGGWLDEVRWIANTDNKEDLEFLDKIIARSPRYKKIIPEEVVRWPKYTHLWRNVTRGTMYVKLDDDLMWLDDKAIPRMVITKLRNPDALAVSANIINAPPLNFIHYHIGALHPYLPELRPDELAWTPPPDADKPEPEPPEKRSPAERSPVAWRPSEHPFWEGPPDFQWHLKRPPPYDPHRWLRLQNDKALNITPVANLLYKVWGPTYSSWAIAAQQHYSLLENIETNNLEAYQFYPPWNMRGGRLRINCLAIMGDTVLDTDVNNWPANQGDEDMLVLRLPKDLQRHILVEGRALAAHFNFAHQGDLAKTDLLDRYQDLARENGCML